MNLSISQPSVSNSVIFAKESNAMESILARAVNIFETRFQTLSKEYWTFQEPPSLAQYIHPRVSYYLPFLAAEAFGITNLQFIREIAVAHFLADSFGHVADDAADLKPIDVRLFHFSYLLGSAAAESFTALLPNQQSFLRHWNGYLLRASTAEQYLRTIDQSQEFPQPAFTMMAEKSAYLNASAAACAIFTNRLSLLRDFEIGSQHLFSAIQLIDDLYDCREDFMAEHHTFPIERALRSGATLSADSVEETLARTDVGIEIIKKASRHLNIGMQKLDSIGAKSADGIGRRMHKHFAKLEQSIKDNGTAANYLPLSQMINIMLCH